jgi:thiamine biosynthesis lipoprotein
MQMIKGLAEQITHPAMGTVMTHVAFGPNAGDCLAEVGAEITRIEGLFSRFLPESDICRINTSAGMRSERVSRETYNVLEKATQFSDRFPGCFDITIQPLVALWNQARASCDPPDADSIQKVLPLVNDRDLVLDPLEGTAGLRNPGQSLDLGGIGKGFAGDSILEIYARFGITSAYSNLGGNVVTYGAKPDGSPWRIGIQHPRLEDALLGAVSVAGKTVVTSGDYQRFFTDKHGVRHHHILDPRDGCPADSGLISVSVVSGCSLEADALSTILFVAGLEKGLQILRNYPGTEAVFVSADLNVTITRGLEDCFQAQKSIEFKILDGMK